MILCSKRRQNGLDRLRLIFDCGDLVEVRQRDANSWDPCIVTRKWVHVSRNGRGQWAPYQVVLLTDGDVVNVMSDSSNVIRSMPMGIGMVLRKASESNSALRRSLLSLDD